jgi:hypothetical protein
MDEETETTLVRVLRHQPVTQRAVDDAAHVLAQRFGDPSREENWLKRPARRICLHCGGVYHSRISVLAAPPFCSKEHERAAGAEWVQMRREHPELYRAESGLGL